jgi:putative hydrolase of the HAD superfamily
LTAPYPYVTEKTGRWRELNLIPRAILFDLDDTIITEGARFPILIQVAEELAASLAPYSPVAVADALERALQAFWSDPARAKVARLGVSFGIRQARERVIGDVFRSMGLGAGAPSLATTFCDRFSELRSLSAQIFDGARHTLESFREMGVLMALVTNGASDIQRAKLERFSLAALFDHVQIEGEHGFGKPEERAYRHAMQVLGVEPSETWMVGDNLEWEIAAPQRLGVYAIWHDHLGRGLPPDTSVRPDRIVRSLSELLPISS